MMVQNVVGGIFFSVTWIGLAMYGIAAQAGVDAFSLFSQDAIVAAVAGQASDSDDAVSSVSLDSFKQWQGLTVTADEFADCDVSYSTGSLIAVCDDSLHSWVYGASETTVVSYFFSDDSELMVERTVLSNGIVSEITVDKQSGSISSYIG